MMCLRSLELTCCTLRVGAFCRPHSALLSFTNGEFFFEDRLSELTAICAFKSAPEPLW